MIADIETIILFEYIQRYWRGYFEADKHGYTNFIWTFLHSDESVQLDFLEFIYSKMNHES